MGPAVTLTVTAGQRSWCEIKAYIYEFLSMNIVTIGLPFTVTEIEHVIIFVTIVTVFKDFFANFCTEICLFWYWTDPIRRPG